MRAGLWRSRLTPAQKFGGMQRLKYEAAVAFRQIPDGLSSLVRTARAGKLGIRLNHHRLALWLTFHLIKGARNIEED